jgi:ELP3 family radical SAM enzyme/protein acetyltransferase
MHKKIIKKLLSLKNPTSNDLAHIKRNLSKECKMPYPNNISLLREYHNLVKNKRIKKSKAIEDLLRVRPVRSLSGVVNVSVLTKPYACPGICTFCPKEENIPKSYLSGEPAVERAKRLNYDPYLQVKKRIEVLKSTGHNVQKIDLRIIGGTWSYYEKEYKIWFIKECFNACNQTKSNTLFEAQKLNENAKHRIVGLSFETRPDFITKKELLEMRELGTTKVEIGVQSIYDNILKETKRGHNVATTIKATKLLKDAGFKVSYQVMLNLPLSTPKKDLEMLKELFTNEDFKPEYLEDIIRILESIPEYREAIKIGAGPCLFVGSPENRCGKIALTEITGGTEGSEKMYEKMAQAGIGTVIGMHMSERNKQEAETNNISVVIAGHISSDSLGMNLFLDELEKRGIEVIPCSGLIRIKRF